MVLVGFLKFVLDVMAEGNGNWFVPIVDGMEKQLIMALTNVLCVMGLANTLVVVLIVEGQVGRENIVDLSLIMGQMKLIILLAHIVTGGVKLQKLVKKVITINCLSR